MPLFFPGSSEQFIAPPLQSSLPAKSDKLAELFTDEPLPASYQVDRVRLLAQSPRKIYLYWELARNPFEALRRAFGQRAMLYTLAVRLTDLDAATETLHEASPTRSQWFDVYPDRTYRAEVGLYAPERAFIRLLSSNHKRTPPAGVARQTAQEPEWRVSNRDFARVLDDAGYASDALEVALEAADEATHDGATRAVARQLGAENIPRMSEEELAELRGLLTALAFGMAWNNLRPMLSPKIGRWFDELDGLKLDAARLTEILNTTLGIEMSHMPFEASPEAARRRAARVIVGASEVNLPSRPFHLWLPSMTPGALKGIREEG